MEPGLAPCVRAAHKVKPADEVRGWGRSSPEPSDVGDIGGGGYVVMHDDETKRERRIWLDKNRLSLVRKGKPAHDPIEVFARFLSFPFGVVCDGGSVSGAKVAHDEATAAVGELVLVCEGKMESAEALRSAPARVPENDIASLPRSEDKTQRVSGGAAEPEFDVRQFVQIIFVLTKLCS